MSLTFADEPDEPYIVDVKTYFKGRAGLQMEFSIPQQVQPDAAEFLSQHAARIASLVDEQHRTLGSPAPASRLQTSFDLQLKKDSNPSGESEEVLHGVQLRDRCIASREDIFNAIIQLAEETRTRIEALIECEHSSVHIVNINSAKINLVPLVRCQSLGNYVPYPKKHARGAQHIFNPKTNNNCILHSIAGYNVMKKRNTYASWKIQRSLGTKWSHHVKFDKSSADSWASFTSLERLNSMNIYVYSLDRFSAEGGDGEEVSDFSEADEDSDRIVPNEPVRVRSSKKSHSKERYFLSMVRKPVAKSHTIKRENVHLLLLENCHIALIKDFDKFVRAFARTNKKGRICKICLHVIAKNELHTDECRGSHIVEYPSKGEVCKFKNYHKMYPPSHVAFYDFEALQDSTQQTSTVRAIHKAVAFCYIILDRNNTITDSCIYTGEDAATVFLDKLRDSWEQIKIASKRNEYPINTTPEQDAKFQAATECDICSVEFDATIVKHKHHSHDVEHANYAGALCARCNLQFKNIKNTLVCLAHNHSYDLQLVLKEAKQNVNISVLPKQASKYHTVCIDSLKFIDSFAFYSASLAKIADLHINSKNGQTLKEKLPCTHYLLREYSDQAKHYAMTGKQFFPYEYIDSIQKLYQNSLPPIEEFFSKLTQSTITPDEYAQALKLFKAAGCKNLNDYMRIYLLTDVGYLADCISAFRKTLRDLHGLDMVHYVSLPSFSYDSFLYSTGIQLDLIHDPVLGDLIKRNVRGGFTSVVRPYAKANNKNINPDFDPCKDRSSYLTYIDFNSLYATVMEETLPSGNMKKLNDEELSKFTKTMWSHDEDKKIGHWVLCDTKRVAPDIARLTDDLPLAMHHLNITDSMLSPYNKQLLESQNRRLYAKNSKLVASHLPQKNYFLSLKLLQLLVELGLEVDKVHAVYRFSQTKYLKPFIERNIEARMRTPHKSEGNVYKLTNNSVFGRTLFDSSRRLEKTNIVTNVRAFTKMIRDPLYKRCVPLKDNRVIVVRGLPVVKMNSPQYIGMTILDRAKFRLYHFFYKVLKPFYGDNVKLVYTDTDSYVLKIYTDDLYKDFASPQLREYIDTSNFPDSHPSYSNENKGKLGCLKSEVGADYIVEIICLKPKTYSIRIHGREESTVGAKGISTHERQNLTHENFRHVMSENVVHTFTQTTLTAVKGTMSTVQYENKRGLSLFDDKRYYLDKYQSVGYGHPDIPVTDNDCANLQCNSDSTEVLSTEEGEESETDVSTEASMHTEPPAEEEGSSHSIWKERENLAKKYFKENNNRSCSPPPPKRSKFSRTPSARPRNSGRIIYKEGDITSAFYRSRNTIIVQQTNCISVQPHGLSAQLAEKYPYSDLYTKRTPVKDYNRAIPEHRGKPGDILMCKPPSGLSLPLVACIHGQFYMGRNVNCNMMSKRLLMHLKEKTLKDEDLIRGIESDTGENRLNWFRSGLNHLANAARQENIKRIVFPYRIGCGLAKGNWDHYMVLIDRFANEMYKSNIKVYIVEKK